MIKAILADLDGICVPACELHKKAFDKAVGTEFSETFHQEYLNGKPTKTKLRILADQKIIKEEDFQDIWNKKQQFTKELISELKPMWGHIKLWQHFWEKGIKLCCVTNSIRETAELMLKQTGQFEYFDFIITNEDVIENKPSPACYTQAMWQLYLAKSSCLILEDSPVGLQAAVASGAHVLKCKDPSEVTWSRIKPVLDQLYNNPFAASHQQIFGMTNDEKNNMLAIS